MAFEWIKWVKGLAYRPEVCAVASKLGIDRRTVAAACMLIWEWADGCTVDGHVKGVGTGVIDAVAGTDGFSSALEAVGWLRVHENGDVTFPRWGRHNGESAKKRALNYKRQKRLRKDVSEAELSRATRHKKRTRPNKSNSDKTLVGLNNLSLEELKQPPVLLVRWRSLVDRGFRSDALADKLAFFSFAARAVRVGRDKNPCGLFRRLVERWDTARLEHSDEDEGNRMLKSLSPGRIDQ